MSVLPSNHPKKTQNIIATFHKDRVMCSLSRTGFCFGQNHCSTRTIFLWFNPTISLLGKCLDRVIYDYSKYITSCFEQKEKIFIVYTKLWDKAQGSNKERIQIITYCIGYHPIWHFSCLVPKGSLNTILLNRILKRLWFQAHTIKQRLN